jgi:hypothetical protein
MPIPGRPSGDGTSQGNWKRKLLAMGSALALALVGGASGSAFTYLIAGPQEVSAEQAVEAYKDSFDSSVPPVRVENVHFDRGEDVALPQELELPDERHASFYDILDHPDSVVLIEFEELNAAGEPPRGTAVVEFTLVGQHYTPVQIVDITINAVLKNDGPSGTIVLDALDIGPEGDVSNSGRDEVSEIGFDLDSQGRQARTLENDELTTRRFLEKNQVTLNRDEHHSFRAIVYASGGSHDFDIALHLSNGGSIIVNNDGEPWRINGYAASYAQSYVTQAIDDEETKSRFIRCAWPRECIDLRQDGFLEP